MERRIIEENQIDENRELQEKIFDELKVASLAVVKNITTFGYECELIPQLSNKIIKIKTINKLYAQYYDNYSYYDETLESTDPLNKLIKLDVHNESTGGKYNVRYVEDIVQIGDIIVVLFLDVASSHAPSNKDNTPDNNAKHSYDNAVAISKIYNDKIIEAQKLLVVKSDINKGQRI